MWVVMSAPVGIRTVRRRIVVNAPIDRVRSAVHPFGENYAWNDAVRLVERFSEHSGRMVTNHTDRSGGFIEREFVLTERGGLQWSQQFTSDTSLAQDFWRDHRMETQLKPLSAERTEVCLSETDRYRGIAFLVYRYFALRRMGIKLQIWGETNSFTKGGIFEKPTTQLAMATLSAFLLWPFFGLNMQGLFLAAALTLVVGLHELGHIAAFRIMGHRHARMIFIPILGGIAMGGRPYDRHFEIGFSALMGAGFSAFLMAAMILLHPMLEGRAAEGLLVFALMGALFNLGNLIPVWKFDGGQILRQVFRTPVALAAGAFFLLGWFMMIGHLMGLAPKVLLMVAAVFAILSVMTSKGGIKPKTPLTPMTTFERLAIMGAFGAVFSIHASVLLWSTERLFG